MTKIFQWLTFFLFPILLSAEGLRFVSPSYDSPYYRLAFPFEAKADQTFIHELQANGKKCQDVFIFSQGQNIGLAAPVKKGTYEIQADFAWESGKDYKLILLFQTEKSQQIEEIEISGRSPATGGIPAAEPGFYRIYRAEEPAGIERSAEICSLTLTAAKLQIENRPFFLWDGNTQLPYQILEIKESYPHEKAAKDHPPTLTIRMAFPLDISPLEKKLLLILLAQEPSQEEPGFSFTGEGMGKTVRGKKVSLEFHPQSGQVNTVEFIQEGIKLYNEAGVIHWNPGCFVPGIAWDHSFNWNPPPSFEERAGRFLYISARRGPMQDIKEVNLEVKYTLEWDSPYFLSETLMRVEKDLGVKALRNDEMVLYRELFDTLIHKDKQNKIVQMPLKEQEGYPDGFVHAAPEDLAWVGLLNTEKKYGFFSLRIRYASSSLDAAGDWLIKPGTYFYAPSDGKYVYWVRPLLYTWPEYPTRNLLTHVPRGSFFYEKNAYLLLPLEEGYASQLDLLLNKLRNPVRIY